MADDFAIVCKTYRGDIRRAQRLIASLEPHNRERLPVVLVVPQDDLALFREALPAKACSFASDEDVIRSQPRSAQQDLLSRYRATPGYRSQQVVKAEAWRLLGCSAYLCTDADTIFLRGFDRGDFLTPAGHPYTHLHQSKDYRQLALDRGHVRVDDDFRKDCAQVKAVFGRVGPDYDFGPTPVPWAARVWSDLYERHLEPRGQTLWDAIDSIPSELRWYGEALLAFESIPLAPIEPLFRVYHHDWQHALLRRLGETDARVASLYLGAVYQSNWEYELDAPGSRTAASLAVRRLKRWLRQLKR